MLIKFINLVILTTFYFIEENNGNSFRNIIGNAFLYVKFI